MLVNCFVVTKWSLYTPKYGMCSFIGVATINTIQLVILMCHNIKMNLPKQTVSSQWLIKIRNHQVLLKINFIVIVYYVTQTLSQKTLIIVPWLTVMCVALTIYRRPVADFFLTIVNSVLLFCTKLYLFYKQSSVFKNCILI